MSASLGRTAMRIVLVLVAAASLGAGACYGAAAPATSLSIVVYPDGMTQPASAERYTLRCGPAVGTVPQPAVACRTLAALAHPFAPTPRGTFCTDIAMGPQQATVKGRVRGNPGERDAAGAGRVRDQPLAPSQNGRSRISGPLSLKS